MPRKRMIDPKFWTDDKIIKISIPARLLFIAIWNHADDLGVHRNDNFSLKAEVFPIDNISVEEVEKYKNELITVGLVISYTDERDGELLFIKNWYKYQYIKKPTPSKYRLPENILMNFTNDERRKYNERVVDDDYRSSTEVLPPNRKEKNGIEVLVVDRNVLMRQYSSDLKAVEHECKRRIQSFAPDYAGITCTTPTFVDIRKNITPLIKEISSNIKIIVGGPHATAMHKYILNNYKNIDIHSYLFLYIILILF